jgi:hypothetical protein
VLRIGLMLNTPGTTLLRTGNFEGLTEIFGGGVVKGPADVIAGTTLWLRYNVVFPGAWLIPYAQVGAGGVYSDAYKEPVQRELGGPAELQSADGIRRARAPIADECGVSGVRLPPPVERGNRRAESRAELRGRDRWRELFLLAR